MPENKRLQESGELVTVATLGVSATKAPPRAANLEERQANKIAEFRQIAYQLHEQGTELFVNRVLTRMSVAKTLDHRIACEVLAEISREIHTRVGYRWNLGLIENDPPLED